jgi:hypothetical protein
MQTPEANVIFRSSFVRLHAGGLLMARVMFVALAMTVIPAIGLAQDKPKTDKGDDPIAAELTKAKKEYEKVVDKAKEELLVAMAQEEMRFKENSNLGAEDRVKRVEQLQEEKKAFEAEGKLPKSPGLRVAVGDYRGKVGAAQRKCEKAFDVAASEYLKNDLAAAKAILSEKAEFFLPGKRSAPASAKTKDDRRLWRFAKEHGSGYFKLLPDSKWEEIGRNGEKMGIWIERQRTAEYVEIEDQKRGYLTRLGAGKAWMAKSSDGQFNPSPHGDWER